MPLPAPACASRLRRINPVDRVEGRGSPADCANSLETRMGSLAALRQVRRECSLIPDIDLGFRCRRTVLFLFVPVEVGSGHGD